MTPPQATNTATAVPGMTGTAAANPIDMYGPLDPRGHAMDGNHAAGVQKGFKIAQWLRAKETEGRCKHCGAKYLDDGATICADCEGRQMSEKVAETASAYGYCPQCGAPGEWRERRLNGDDTCENGHKYPSKSSLPSPPGEKQSVVHPLRALTDDPEWQAARRASCQGCESVWSAPQILIHVL